MVSSSKATSSTTGLCCRLAPTGPLACGRRGRRAVRVPTTASSGSSSTGSRSTTAATNRASEATSRLSPHLRFGELSPFEVWARVHQTLTPDAVSNRAKFLSEIGWREFSYTILFGRPDLGRANFRPEFDAFPWGEPDAGQLEAWQHGQTGIPIVDAGMRELWTTGYMHNRVRMIVASFLTKNLLVDWRTGEEWFWDTLVDADEASNAASWQWVAGSGADAAPYFRIFNPMLQAEKFDPRGDYVNRWVPEAGTPGYPPPIVDLKASRAEALAAYDAVKAAKA